MSLQNIALMGRVREVKSEIMINSTKARIIIIAILIPVIVALLLEFNLIWEVETDNDWIGFYASYVGSIIGVYGEI